VLGTTVESVSNDDLKPLSGCSLVQPTCHFASTVDSTQVLAAADTPVDSPDSTAAAPGSVLSQSYLKSTFTAQYQLLLQTKTT